MGWNLFFFFCPLHERMFEDNEPYYSSSSSSQLQLLRRMSKWVFFVVVVAAKWMDDTCWPWYFNYNGWCGGEGRGGDKRRRRDTRGENKTNGPSSSSTECQRMMMDDGDFTKKSFGVWDLGRHGDFSVTIL